jgi:hypothetical protein
MQNRLVAYRYEFPIELTDLGKGFPENKQELTGLSKGFLENMLVSKDMPSNLQAPATTTLLVILSDEPPNHKPRLGSKWHLLTKSGHREQNSGVNFDLKELVGIV